MTQLKRCLLESLKVKLLNVRLAISPVTTTSTYYSLSYQMYIITPTYITYNQATNHPHKFSLGATSSSPWSPNDQTMCSRGECAVELSSRIIYVISSDNAPFGFRQLPDTALEKLETSVTKFDDEYSTPSLEHSR